MRVEDIFILRNRKSHAVVVHHTNDPEIKQGVTAKLIVWDGTTGGRFNCRQENDRVVVVAGNFACAIQEQPDGAIRLDELDKDGVPATTTTYPADQDWYFVLEAGLDTVNFPGLETFSQPIQA